MRQHARLHRQVVREYRVKALGNWLLAVCVTYVTIHCIVSGDMLLAVLGWFVLLPNVVLLALAGALQWRAVQGGTRG